MDLVKICDICGMANPATEMICQRCFSDISRTKPIVKRTIRILERKPPQPRPPVAKFENIERDTSKTIREVAPMMLVMAPDKIITVNDGAKVGREFIGSRVLGEFSAVSRHHATFKYTNGKWFVMDENSTNGTYIGEKKIKPQLWYEIKEGDQISFSSGCHLTVRI